MNMHTISQLISTSNFNKTITVIDDLVFINLDWLTNRDYQSQGVNELLFTVGLYNNHRFVFLIRDGVNCKITGLDYAIKLIINNLNLTADSCFIYSYEDLEIQNTTHIRFDVVQMWCSLIYKELKNYNTCGSEFKKKFAALYGRHDLYRLKIFKHLFENYKNESLLSYNSRLGHWNQRFDYYFADDQHWYKNNCPISLDFEGNEGWVPYQKSLKAIYAHYNEYFLEIVAETDVHTNKFFTEKSLKNFYLQKPFILFSGQYSLKELHSKGFQTFSPWIDETYDQISCSYKRLRAILNEVDRLAKIPTENLNQMHVEMLPIFEHNRQNFLKFI